MTEQLKQIVDLIKSRSFTAAYQIDKEYLKKSAINYDERVFNEFMKGLIRQHSEQFVVKYNESYQRLEMKKMFFSFEELFQILHLYSKITSEEKNEVISWLRRLGEDDYMSRQGLTNDEENERISLLRLQQQRQRPMMQDEYERLKELSLKMYRHSGKPTDEY